MLEVGDGGRSGDAAEGEKGGRGGGGIVGVGEREGVKRFDGAVGAATAERIDDADLGVAGEAS